MEDPLVTVRWAAEYLDIHEKTLRRYAADGLLTAYRVSSSPKAHIRFKRSEVEKLFQPTTPSEAVGQA